MGCLGTTSAVQAQKRLACSISRPVQVVHEIVCIVTGLCTRDAVERPARPAKIPLLLCEGGHHCWAPRAEMAYDAPLLHLHSRIGGNTLSSVPPNPRCPEVAAFGVRSRHCAFVTPFPVFIIAERPTRGKNRSIRVGRPLPPGCCVDG